MTSNRSTATILRRALLVVAMCVASVGVITPSADAAPARPAQSVSSGSRTLTVSQNQNLDPNGQTIVVSGSGYDMNKGIYVAYCLEPRPGEIPHPCGGGEDRAGNTGASFWISSNPPSYGHGLAIPYGGGGTFSQTIHVSPQIGNVDCRRVQCVIVTRNDHTRSSDRTQDLFIPLSFAQPAQQQPADPGTPEPPETTTTTTLPQPLPDEERPAPAGEVAEDGRSVTAGDLKLSADRTEDLDPEGQAVIVTGAGFDEDRGVRLAFCAVEDGKATERCLAAEDANEVDGTDEAVTSLDVASNPSDERRESSVEYGPAGSFGTKLVVQAEIDDETDCTEVSCAIVTLAHPDRPLDQGQNLVLPVTFEVEEPPETTTTTEAPATTTTTIEAEVTDQDSSGGGSGPIIAAIVIIILAAGAGGAIWYRRSQAAPESETTSEEP